MNENSAIFIVLMTLIGVTAWLVNKMIKTRHPPPRPDALDAGHEIEQLRRENDQLHERLAVLERIATDPAERTAREIEQLRQG